MILFGIHASHLSTSPDHSGTSYSTLDALSTDYIGRRSASLVCIPLVWPSKLNLHARINLFVQIQPTTTSTPVAWWVNMCSCSIFTVHRHCPTFHTSEIPLYSHSKIACSKFSFSWLSLNILAFSMSKLCHSGGYNVILCGRSLNRKKLMLTHLLHNRLGRPGRWGLMFPPP
jgi:hypothetical protein